jgi:hypothetical protein
MATHLSQQDQSHMLELFQAFSRLDGRALGDCALKFSGDEQVRSCARSAVLHMICRCSCEMLALGTWQM